MGEIYNEFVGELNEIALKYKGRPDKELDKLLQIALEREELVATAYRADFLHQNIERLAIDNDLKTIIRHALIWIWKDEDMHTVYTRGALLKSNNYFYRLRIFISQFEGYVGGWAGSIIQHLTWKEAPISVFVAKTILLIGGVSGKIPKELRNELKHGTFKNFCNFNVDAEKTARVCWERIFELAKKDNRYNEQHITDFQRIIFDESRHGKVFQTIYDSLTEQDTLKEGCTKDNIVGQIKKISDYFLPANFREQTINPVGSGGIVWVAENKETLNKVDFFIKELEKTELAAELFRKAKALNQPIDTFKIVIKVSFSMGYNKTDLSPINDPLLLNVFAKYIYDLGFRNIKVLDIDSIYINFFNNRSVNQLASYFGFESNYYQVINASEELVKYNYSRGIGNYSISKIWKDADFRINFGKIKSHPIEMALLSINNLEWLTGNTKEFVFVDRVVDRTTVTCMLLDDFPPEFNIMEAYDLIPIGILGVMGCKNPIEPKRFYFGRDAIAIDLAISKHLNIKNLSEKSSLKSTLYWFGINNLNYTIVGEDSLMSHWKSPTKNLFWAFLGFISMPVYQLLSNKGELFVPDMDTKTFPSKKTPGFISVFRIITRKITNLP